MTDYKTALDSDFQAAFSKKNLEEGELKHADVEQLRKISMFAGLAHSSKELELLCSDNPRAFRNALKSGIQSIEHYQNVLSLLENAILRIYSIAANHATWEDGEDIENLEDKVKTILSTSSIENQH